MSAARPPEGEGAPPVGHESVISCCLALLIASIVPAMLWALATGANDFIPETSVHFVGFAFTNDLKME
ncbi:hypothetical protein [Verminephrobacter eiseniae]|uniref:hypothetical protein n=1 Tax=Verminephrobacter eiseniae TaxID=364317 RepID=UPI0010EF020D|nr:hypothetical protein [Verminephrobacter eiseniae]KAB7619369.1 hypothetical protein ET532_006875 [Verminephrobacter sp. Larva24]MCW5291595.1 hypothetical protein [Verminephrobacter eiseniae]MCW8234620.1 hypothetical protein [Verminephrobacter eiseniae]